MADLFQSNDPGPVIRKKLNTAWAAWELAIATIKGDRGWSPLIRTVADGSRIVFQLYAWTGGQGAAPTTTGYMGAAGIVAAIAQAMDVRGAQGLPGDPALYIGSGPAQLAAGGQLGALAYMDDLGVTVVHRHTPDSKPGDVWREMVNSTTTVMKYHGSDGVIRTRTESWT